MSSSGLGAYQVKIHQILFGGLFFLLVLAGVKGMMSGGPGSLKQLGAMTVFLGTVLALDRYYWILFVCLSGFAINIPGLPFDGSELGCIVLISVYFIRQAMHKEQPIRLTADLLVAFPVFTWIVFVWMINPTGMAILGSSSIGARFYFKIVLGFISLHVLSAIRLHEQDCKILFRLLMISALYSAASTVFREKMGGISMDDGLWDQDKSHYEFLGAVMIYVLIFSRYSLSEILRSVSKTAFILICAVLTIYSGKRRGLGTLLLVPVLRSWLTRKDKLITAGVGAVVFFLMCFIISGNDVFYELPHSAKRSLAIFVPAFATQTSGGTKDLFRETVRQRGREVIRESPWVGRKGFAMDRSETSWIVSGGALDDFSEEHAFSGNWHSTWYAFAADFGIPCAIFWGVFMLYALTIGFKTVRSIPPWTYAGACSLYYVMSIYLDTLFSYTSGHSSLTAMGEWLIFGMVLAIRNGAREARYEPVERIAV